MKTLLQSTTYFSTINDDILDHPKFFLLQENGLEQRWALSKEITVRPYRTNDPSIK
jgi:hypothetical protein